MPSPFPGMDPYIEGQAWSDFHARFLNAVSDVLTPDLRPRYAAWIEERVYLQHDPDEDGSTGSHIRPDVSVLKEKEGPRTSASGTAVLTEAVRMPIAMPEEMRERFLEIRLRETHELVCILEVLSPANKAPGSSGRREYLRKRDSVLLSAVHLVEIDLLRGGQRLPMKRRYPECDQVVIVSRSSERPEAGVWPVLLGSPLPVVPIPLAGSDPDVALDLQEVFRLTYDRAGYDYRLDYRAPLDPPLPPETETWVRAAADKA